MASFYSQIWILTQFYLLCFERSLLRYLLDYFLVYSFHYWSHCKVYIVGGLCLLESNIKVIFFELFYLAFEHFLWIEFLRLSNCKSFYLFIPISLSIFSFAFVKSGSCIICCYLKGLLVSRLKIDEILKLLFVIGDVWLRESIVW